VPSLRRHGTLTFVPDENAKTVTVQVNGDAFDEEETFSFGLIDLSGATLANGQVLPHQEVTAPFSEAMDPTTLDATIFNVFRKRTAKPVVELSDARTRRSSAERPTGSS
jgi:hypothetical protein